MKKNKMIMGAALLTAVWFWFQLPIELKFALIFIASMGQPNILRMFAAMTFILIAVIHDYIAIKYEVKGDAYYAYAAISELIVIVLISGISPLPKMVLRLQQLCLLSIWLNFAGFVLYNMYVPGIYYEIAFELLYLAVIILFINMDKSERRRNANNRLSNCFRYSANSLLRAILGNGGKI